MKKFLQLIALSMISLFSICTTGLSSSSNFSGFPAAKPFTAFSIGNVNSLEIPYYITELCSKAVCPNPPKGRTSVRAEFRIVPEEVIRCLQRFVYKKCKNLSKSEKIKNSTSASQTSSDSRRVVINKGNSLPAGSFSGEKVVLNNVVTLMLKGMNPKIRKMLNSSEVQVSRAMRGKKRTRLVYYLTIR
jgi:hypothetical protein